MAPVTEFSRSRTWFILLSFLYVPASSSMISICTSNTTYKYDIDQCPGGIQLRNINRWVTKSHSRLCICGQGSILQFDGEDQPWHENVYPIGFPLNLKTFLGSWKHYSLSGDRCEALQEKTVHPSVLLIDGRVFENPQNFPSRAIELITEPTEHKRICGSYSIQIKRGIDSKSALTVQDILKTILVNTNEPVLISPDLENRPFHKVCAFDEARPEFLVSKYISTEWNTTNIAASCRSGTIEPFIRSPQMCNAACETNTNTNTTANANATTNQPPNPNKRVASFIKFFELMAEVSLRMKYSEKRIPFIKDSEPHTALLQLSSRLFFRAFPNVVKWETLLNAVTIFGVSFEGLIPNKMDTERFDQIRLALGRCTLQQERDRRKNTELYKQLCSALPSQLSAASSAPQSKLKRQVPKPAGSISSLSHSRITRNATSPPPPSPRVSIVLPKATPEFNKLVDLLWKMVQFAQMKCLSTLEHHPNVHHYFVESMVEVFSSPAVQLIWFSNLERVDKAMLYILPELPDNTLQIIDGILARTEYSTYYNLLQRPKIQNLDRRDMECAGHGKLIWDGKACCYFEEDDKKYRFYNRVAFAKI